LLYPSGDVRRLPFREPTYKISLSVVFLGNVGDTPFWGFTKSSTTSAWYRSMLSPVPGVGKDPNPKMYGLSIRRIKDYYALNL